MSVTCFYSGRFGNIIFHAAQLIAYAKKYDLPYYLPETAVAYTYFKNGNVTSPLALKSTGSEPINPTTYEEPNDANSNPYYHDIPKMDNVKFVGWYQSFKYFDWCRDYILETFNFPYNIKKGVVSISHRRGDCLGSTAFPIAPPEYYHRAVQYMQRKGYNFFLVHSDDQEWCRNEFTPENYRGAAFEFTTGSEMDDYLSIMSCEHNITARSTFSLTAAWFNRNPNKIVCVPTAKHRWWNSQNKDLIPDYFTQIDWDVENSDKNTFVYDFDGGSFKLIINSYWNTIMNGKPREELYHDYRVMVDFVKQKISRDRYILDVGANCGIFSVPVSMLGYKVVGFEPVKTNIDSLLLARTENNLKNFDMFHAALSNKKEEVDIYIPECHDNASLSQEAAVANMIGKDYTTEKVQAFVFDDWIKEHYNFNDIGLIKIDVQGAEHKVLEGMQEFLSKAHDIYIIAEYENHLNTMGYTFEQLDNLLLSYGFEDKSKLCGNDKLWHKR